MFCLEILLGMKIEGYKKFVIYVDYRMKMFFLIGKTHK